MPHALTLNLDGPKVTLSPLVLADGSGPPRQQTRIEVLATEIEFRVTFGCDDTDPWGTLTTRDDPLYEEECVEVFLAPGERDPVDYFEFEISPLGTVFDARIHNPHGRRESMTADTGWDAGGAISNAAIMKDTHRWIATLVLPWSDLGFPDPADLPRVWRVNFFRIDRPRDGSPPEFSCWSPTLENPANFHVPKHFGTLRLV